MATYKDAGVDIDAQDKALEQVKKMVRNTYTRGVLSDQGAFGGLFRVPKGFKEPVLVASADGVGTKLKVAIATGRNGTVGQDLVNHCINDILVQGARPLFFLDYCATGQARSRCGGRCHRWCGDRVLRGRGGPARRRNRRDARFLRRRRLRSGGLHRRRGRPQGDPRRIQGRPRAMCWSALPSTGLHTNGYSLARKVLLDDPGFGPDDVIPELGCSVGEELLKIHRCYVNEVWPLLEKGFIHAMAHITGGGLTDNLPRVTAQETPGGGQGRRVGDSAGLQGPRRARRGSRGRLLADLQHGRRDGPHRAAEETQEGPRTPQGCAAARASPWAMSSRESRASSTTTHRTGIRPGCAEAQNDELGMMNYEFHRTIAPSQHRALIPDG